LTLCLDHKFFGAKGIFRCLCNNSPIPCPNILYYNESGSTSPHLLADFCTYHSFHFWTLILVYAKPDFSWLQATGSYRVLKEDIVVPTDVDKIEQALLEFECT